MVGKMALFALNGERGQFYKTLTKKRVKDLQLICGLVYCYLCSYRIEINGTSQPQIEDHDSTSSSRISTTWTGLTPGQAYTFTVICQLPMNEDCEGVPPTFTASTVPCSGT